MVNKNDPTYTQYITTTNHPENRCNSLEKNQIRAIAAFEVSESHRGREQSKAPMRFAISD